MTIFWKIAHFLYSKHINHLARLFEEINYIICGNAIIGKDCKIFPNVMIGDAFKKGILNSKAPKIGNSVFIGTGAVLLGDITIGDGAVIGANAVVIHDVDPGKRVGGIPAKEI